MSNRSTNNLTIVLIISIITSLLFGISSYVFVLTLSASYIIFVVGILLFVLAIPIHFLGKKGARTVPYCMSICFTTIGSGLSAAGYYLYRKEALTVSEVLVGVLICIITNVILHLLFSWVPNKGACKLIGGSLLAVLVILFVYLWNNAGSAYNSYLFFTTILATFTYLVYLITAGTDRPVYRDISFGSFGIFLVITTVVLIILSDGDALEFLDVFDTPGTRRKHNRG